MSMQTTVIDYTVYEDSTEFLGIAEVGLPDLEFMTQTITGNGIGGELVIPIMGQVSAMEMDMKFLTRTAATEKLSTPVEHLLELREVQQNLGASSVTTSVEAVKHVIKAIPKSSGGGTLKPASTTDPTVSMAVHYWATYRNGTKTMEIDPVGYVCYINGVDYAEAVRSALGK